MNLNKSVRIVVLALVLALGLVSGACTAQPGGGTTTTAPTSIPNTVPPTVPAPTTWDFTLHVSVNDQMVTKYGGLAATRALIDQQLATVNQHFAGFAKPIRWIVKDLVAYSGSALTQAQLGTNGANYSLTYTEQPVPENGGWRPPIYSIIINFLSEQGGVFGQYGAPALTHEFGHVRGAIEMYELIVDAAHNPVNGVAYAPPLSWMSLWYDPSYQVWDTYTANIINASAGSVYNDDHVVMNSTPSSYQAKVLNTYGVPVSNATIKLYPVEWNTFTPYTNVVGTSPTMNGTSSSNGTWALPSNPFNPNVSFYWWHIQRPLFLVTATVGTKTGSAWLSLPDAGNWFFAHPGMNYQFTITVA